MDSRQLQLVLKLQDNASRELRKITGELDSAERKTRDWDSTLLAAKRTVMAVGAAAVGALGFGVKIAADLQTAEVGLTTLLGSAEEAEETLARLKLEAARTPFELPGLTQATQLLTSVTKDGDRSIDILLDVGEALAAMGKGQSELDRIIVNLQQIAATGRAATIDIRQFAFAGIPIYEMLTETTGKSGEALEELITSGGVTFELLTQMFDEANDAGGRFANAFVNQSGTFNQALSNMKDSVGIFLSDIATQSGLLDGLTQAMMGVATVIGNYEEIISNAKQAFVDFFEMVDEKTLLITHFKGLWDTLAQTYTDILKPAIDELYIAFLPLMPYLETLGQVIGFVLVAALHTLIALLRAFIPLVAAVISGLASFATFIIDTVVYALKQLDNWVQLIIAVFTGDWAGAIQVVQNMFEDLLGWIDDVIGAFKRAIDLAKELGGSAIDFVAGLLPGRAVGGSVASGRPYMVGENGPEMFVPRGNGTIVPNYGLEGGGNGGVTVIVHGDVSGEELVDKVEFALAGRIKERERVR